MVSSVLRYLSDMRDTHLEQLKQFLRFPSVSSLPAHQEDVRRCALYLADHLQSVGFEHVRLLETDGHPVVYADWLHAPGKPTVLVYGHYDVQPADPLEEWQSPPFEPAVRDGLLFARGASDNKGQLFMQVKVFEAYLKTVGSLPVNVKLCIEGEEESGSPHLPLLLQRCPQLFAADVIVISDTAMLGPEHPSVCYGLRGLASCEIEVKGADSDLPSGLYGGAVQNAAQALAELLASMKGRDGSVTIAGFYDQVSPLSDQEREAIRSLPQDDRRLAAELGVPQLFGEAGYSTWERRWTRPTLEVNGISAGYQGPGIQTIIPCRATAKLSCRLVPRQDPDQIFALIEEHVRRHTPPGVTASVRRLEAALPYVAPLEHPAVQLAAKAYETGYGKPAAFIRAGGSIPIVETFARHYHVPVVLMGFALPDAHAHAPNERFSLANFDRGMRTLCWYWQALGGIYAADGSQKHGSS